MTIEPYDETQFEKEANWHPNEKLGCSQSDTIIGHYFQIFQGKQANELHVLGTSAFESPKMLRTYSTLEEAKKAAFRHANEKRADWLAWQEAEYEKTDKAKISLSIDEMDSK